MKWSCGRLGGAAVALALALTLSGAVSVALASARSPAGASLARVPSSAPSRAAASSVAASSSPFAGTALWVTQVAPLQTPAQLAAQAAQAGARTLLVKAGDGSTPDLQFSAALVAGLRAAGVSVCAWTFAYGEDPAAEAAVALAAVRAGAQCLVVDAEGQYDCRYPQAQAFVRDLRSQLGASFPIALAGQAEVLEHPTFPYSVFLAPGSFQFDLPQMYWLELGVSVRGAYAASLATNAIYGRTIVPVGQLAGDPAPTAVELASFRSLARAYGSPGVSFFDLDSAQPGELAALAAPAAALARRALPLPTLRPGGDGDEIVRAQELLDGAGARLPVGGFYGAETDRAVARFQARHHLSASGVLTPATWRALLRVRPREPAWSKPPPACTGNS